MTSSDTEIIICLSHIPELREKGLQQLGVEFGSSEHSMQLHVLSDKLGAGLWRVIAKVYVLICHDVLSKIGTTNTRLLVLLSQIIYVKR